MMEAQRRPLQVVADAGEAGHHEDQRDVGFWCRYALGREFPGKPGWELQNLLTVARLMIEAARTRDESRGTHYRSDFPVKDDARWGLRHVESSLSLTE